jgi:hypothetical protein
MPRSREHGRPRDAPKNHSRMDGASEGQATHRRTGCGIRQKGNPAKRVPSQSARSGPSISARSVPESYGMALASRWKVIAAWQAGRRCGGRRLWAMAQPWHGVSLKRVTPLRSFRAIGPRSRPSKVNFGFPERCCARVHQPRQESSFPARKWNTEDTSSGRQNHVVGGARPSPLASLIWLTRSKSSTCRQPIWSGAR